MPQTNVTLINIMLRNSVGKIISENVVINSANTNHNVIN